MNKSERLKEIRKSLGLNQKEFGDLIKVTQQNVGKMENGKRPIGQNMEFKILTTLKINPTWWDKGEGEIFLGKTGEGFVPSPVMSLPESNTEPIEGLDDLEYAPVINGADGVSFQQLPNGSYLMSMPLVDQYAEAGYLSGYSDPDYLEELPRHTIFVDKEHTGVYRAFKVRGDSMDDDSIRSIPAGAIVAGRRVEREYYTYNRLHLRKWHYFIIVHKEGIVIKEVVNHDVQAGRLHLRSLNPDKARYPDYVVPMENVIEILNIVSKLIPM